MKTSRQLVVEALCHMEKEDAWSNLALSHLFDEAALSQQDRSFASALFYGTLTRRYTIDVCLKAHSKTKLQKMDPIVRNILRTAVFQLLYMNSVPDHAAVSEGVNLTRKMKKTSASGFVNGVLRSFLRSQKVIPMPDPKKTIETLAVTYSCPPELVKLWIESYGEENTKILLKESLEAPPTFLRINSTKITQKELEDSFTENGILWEAVPNASNCLQLQGQGAVHELDEYKKGYFHIQDFSSQQAALTVGATGAERILDCCAAPGGKTFVLAEEMKNQGEVVSCDVYQHRTEEIDNRNSRLGLKTIITKTQDMTEYDESLGSFDRVLCDAPCSGYGTIRRRPEIKYHLPSNFTELPELQLELLTTASKYCKKDGILVYSTCTLNPMENQNVVEKFLENNTDFSYHTPDNPMITQPQQTIFIGDHGGDGFFIACMKRA